ncbi:MAG TPA: 50S ribosomal protein L32 [Acidimicrobiales bacterium]|nr:50S ribosomal protein L32 [Acidimicrobiales bacterium]
MQVARAGLRASEADESERTMAVPKKKTSKAKTRSRRASSWSLHQPPRSVCPQCHQAKLPHVVCPTCGWYHGRQAIEVE